MNIDTLMAIAFGLFVVLLVWRMRERFLEGKKKMVDDENIKTPRMRRWFSMLLLVILGGAIIYMIFVSIRDFSTFSNSSIVVRSLLFFLAIYMFILNLLRVLKGSNKGETVR